MTINDNNFHTFDDEDVADLISEDDLQKFLELFRQTFYIPKRRFNAADANVFRLAQAIQNLVDGRNLKKAPTQTIFRYLVRKEYRRIKAENQFDGTHISRVAYNRL